MSEVTLSERDCSKIVNRIYRDLHLELQAISQTLAGDEASRDITRRMIIAAVNDCLAPIEEEE